MFQAYLTTFLIEPGYEEPITSVEQMIKSEKKFGFIDEYDVFFNNDTESVESAILSKAVRCPDRGTNFKWAATYQNMTILFDNLNMGIFHDMGIMKDGNNRPLLCELEDGGVANVELVLLVYRGTPLLEFINEIIVCIVESGIFTHMKKRYFHRENIVPMFDSTPFDDTYSAFNVSHLQTAFYLLMLGYVLSLACFFIEIMWHSYRSKGRGPTRTSLCHGQT